MAGFDPQVQSMGDSPFVYGFGARPIQQPKADTSGEITGKTVGGALKGAGNLVEEGSKLAYNVTKENIDTQLHQQYDPVQSDWINRWSKVDDVLQKNPSAMENIQKNYPTDIQKLPGMVDQLMALRDNGKVPQTYLDMQKDTIAKNMRAKYPGMRDVIDSEFSRMTREDPANKVISQITEDINAYQAAARASKDKVGNIILKSEMEGNVIPQGSYRAYQANPKMGDAILAKIYQHNGVINSLKEDDLKMRNAVAHRTLDKDTAADNNTAYVGKLAAKAFSNLQITLPGLHPMGIQDLLNNYHSGSLKLDPQQALVLQQTVMAAKNAAMNEARQAGAQPLDPNNPNSPTRASLMGGKEYEALVEDQIGKQFDSVADDLGNEKYGVAHMTAEMNKVTMDEEGSRALKTIPGMAAIAELGKIAPQSTYTQKFAEQQFFGGDSNKVQENLKPFIAGTVATMASQPEIKTTGIHFTLGQSLDNSKAAGLSGPKYSTANQAIISGALWAMQSPDSPFAVKHNMANAIYGDPDTVSKVNDSSVDRRGNITPGKSTLLSQTVNVGTTQSVKKLNDPDVTLKYINYAKKSVGLVIGRELASFKDLENDPNVHLKWNSKTHQVEEALGFQGGQVGHLTFGQIQQAQDFVKKVNLALRSMTDVATKLTHEDVDEFLAQFLYESGYQGKLFQAIKAAHEKQDGNRNQ